MIGQAPRSEVRSGNLLHREVAALVRNEQGEIYVHRRTETKDVFPGLYDMFIAGVVTAGESTERAIRRELEEELAVIGVDPEPLFTMRYQDRTLNSWTRGYHVVWNGPIHHQAEEISWGRFLPEPDLVARLEEWEFVPDGLTAFRRFVLERAD